jgi:hypothetical protein
MKYLLPIKSLPQTTEFNEDSWAWSLATFTAAHVDLFNKFLNSHRAVIDLYRNAYNLREEEAFMRVLESENPKKVKKNYSVSELGEFMELEIFARSWFYFIFQTYYPHDLGYSLDPF